jgi:hypothetical protein
MKEIGGNHANITEILKKLSLEEKIPEATLRFNAKKLKELDVVKFGDRFNKGEIAELTPLGLLLCKILNGELKSLKRNALFCKIKKINRGKND